MEVIAQHGQQCRIGVLQVLTESRTLVGRQAELDWSTLEERLAEIEELLRSHTHHAVRTVGGFDVAAGESLMVGDDERQQTREIAVLYAWYQRAILAERTREQHAQLRAGDARTVVDAIARDRLMLGSFAEGGVVVGHRTAPYVGDNRSLGLVYISAAVLALQSAIESRVGRIAGNDQRLSLVYTADQIECQISDTLAASGRTDDEALQVGVIAFAGQSVAEIEVRQATARSGQQREQENVAFGVRLCERHNGLDHSRQRFRRNVFGDVQILLCLRHRA